MNSDEQEIRQLVVKWIEATKNGDIDAVLGLMADDVVFLVAGQPPMVGKSAFAAAMRAQAGQGRPQFEGRSEIQEIRVLGDWAYMWTKLTIVLTPPGGMPAIMRAGHTLSILKKQDSKWLLTRDANMLTTVQAT
jgi:uncharacterized protein (TIGR02246 family)